MGVDVGWYPPCLSSRAMTKHLGLVGGLVLGAASIVACGSDDAIVEPPSPTTAGDPAKGGDGPGQMVGVNEDGVPIGPDGQPLTPQLHGKYELSNKFDLSSAGVFPEVVSDTLRALSDFREKPSSTLVQLIDAANLPVVDNVLSVIPGAIKNLFFGFIDEHVFKALYAKVPVTKQITGLLDDIASIVTKFEVLTTLDLPEGDAIGDARASHAIAGMAYNWSEKRHEIRAPELLSNLTVQPVDTNAVALEKLSSELETARLSFEDHTFSVPIGTFAVYAAEKLAKDKFGKESVRAVIGDVVNCKALAENVAARCIGTGGTKVCVGHAPEIEGFCSTGLDILVGVLLGQLKNLDLPFLYLEQGTAQMWDAPAEGQPLDAIVSRLDRGYWTALVNIGGTKEPILATFTGRRL